MVTAEEGVETEDVLAPRLLLSTRLSKLMSWREADGGAFVFVGVAHCPPRSFLIALACNDLEKLCNGPSAVTHCQKMLQNYQLLLLGEHFQPN